MEEIVLYLDLSRLSTWNEEILIFWSRPFRKKGGPLPIQFIWEAAGGGRSPRHGGMDTHSCDSPFEEATARVKALLTSRSRITAVRRSA